MYEVTKFQPLTNFISCIIILRTVSLESSEGTGALFSPNLNLTNARNVSVIKKYSFH